MSGLQLERLCCGELLLEGHAEMSQKIDVERVERELVSALAADRKYSRENDAKIRAVTQRVATYDEFREIVKGSHLRPLEEKDRRGSGGFRQPWNIAACEKKTGKGEQEEVWLSEGGLTLNLQSFMREWRRLASQPHDQYSFLLQIGKDRLSQLFKVEISMGLLGDILSVMNKCFLNEDARSVWEILNVLSQSSRFKLSVDFLSRSERGVSYELFVKLADSTHLLDSYPSLEQLSALYGHKLTI